MRIRVLVINRKKNVYDISNAISSNIKYTTTRVGSASTISFDVVKSGEISFHEGDMVKIFVDKKLYIVCYIFAKSKKEDVISLTCYDILRYMQYKQSYNFSKKTATQIIKQVANEFKIKIGNIADTIYILPDKIYEDKTLLDIVTDALMKTTVKTKKVYTLFDDAGKLTLKESSNMISNYILGNKSLATTYTYKTSIEESYNYVKLVKPNKKSGKGETYIAFDDDKVKKWGHLQFYKKVDENLNDAQIREMAKTYLKYYSRTKRTLKLECLGVKEIRAGSVVLIDIPSLGDIDLKKLLLIEKCTHTLSETQHTMSLEMNVIND